MGNSRHFLASLEAYGWARIKKSPLPWSYVGITLIFALLIICVASDNQSTTKARTKTELVKMAVQRGDYSTAEKYFDERMNSIEDLVYPRRKIERRIVELREKADQYPESVDLYVGISKLYQQLDESELASEYREKARILSPNESKIK